MLDISRELSHVDDATAGVAGTTGRDLIMSQVKMEVLVSQWACRLQWQLFLGLATNDIVTHRVVAAVDKKIRKHRSWIKSNLSSV